MWSGGGLLTIRAIVSYSRTVLHGLLHLSPSLNVRGFSVESWLRRGFPMGRCSFQEFLKRVWKKINLTYRIRLDVMTRGITLIIFKADVKVSVACRWVSFTSDALSKRGASCSTFFMLYRTYVSQLVVLWRSPRELSKYMWRMRPGKSRAVLLADRETSCFVMIRCKLCEYSLWH